MLSNDAIQQLITDKPAIVTRRDLGGGKFRYERVPLRPDGRIEIDTTRPEEFLRIDVVA